MPVRAEVAVRCELATISGPTVPAPAGAPMVASAAVAVAASAAVRRAYIALPGPTATTRLAAR